MFAILVKTQDFLNFLKLSQGTEKCQGLYKISKADNDFVLVQNHCLNRGAWDKNTKSALSKVCEKISNSIAYQRAIDGKEFNLFAEEIVDKPKVIKV